MKYCTVNGFSRNKGSALLWVIIMSFVLITIVSALEYNFRFSKMAIDSLAKNEQHINVHESYFSHVMRADDMSNHSDENVGDYSFKTSLDTILPGFNYNGANVELYQADPYLISYKLTHNFSYNNQIKYIREFVFNILPSKSMTIYDGEIIPINAPYINIDGLNDDLATYLLGEKGNTVGAHGGYVGYIKKPIFENTSSGNGKSNGKNNNGNGQTKIDICHNPTGSHPNTLNVAESSWGGHKGHEDYRGQCFDNNSETFSVNIYSNNLAIAFPTVLSLSDYDLSIGWSLVDGEWSLHLAIHDLDRVYTSSTTLTNLQTNSSQAEVDLSNWHSVGGLSFGDGDVILTKWYNDLDKDLPKLVILKKVLKSFDYYLDVYKTVYGTDKKTLSAVFTDDLNFDNDDFDTSSVHISLPDTMFTLGNESPLIFVGSSVLDFNSRGHYLLGDGISSTKSTLISSAIDTPVLIKKNSQQFFIMYFNGGTVYKYLYSFGISTPPLVLSRIFYGQTIKKLIAKFGMLFIVTDTNIYVGDILNSKIISYAAISGDDYQIHRETSGRIYAMPNGLECTIGNNCNSSSRIYLDSGCASYSGGCEAMTNLNDVSPYMGVVYKGFSR